MYTLYVKLCVEWNDCKFYFVNRDEIFLALMRELPNLTSSDGATVDTTKLSDDSITLFFDVFNDCVTAWEGIVDENGKEIKCTKEAKAAFPPEDKIAIATAYFEKREEIAKKKG